MSDDAHDALFSPATLMLGKIHWTLLKAANFMEALRWNKVKTTEGFSSNEFTDFGKEVGLDEINWWVFKKETNIDELRAKTHRALKPAQALKKASSKLSSKHPDSYEDMLSTLRAFAEKHIEEIEALYDYVRWLEARDPMAARILFTYRVWGSTRMSDRWIGDSWEPPELTESEVIRRSTEIVLGICSRGRRVYDQISLQIQFEILSDMDPEFSSRAGTIAAPTSLVVARTAREAYAECATYFTEFRDSLRNILLDIEKFEEYQEPMRSDAFWRKFIVKAVQSRKAETQLWDFKETLTMWHVKEQTEKDRAKVAFAEDIASLANSRGGVLVVGVSDQREIVGLRNSSRDLENHLKTVQAVVAKHVEYVRDIVSLQQVVVPYENEKRVCLVVIVAQACDPVAVNYGDGRYSYPVRQETGVERVSRSVLSARKRHMKADNHDFIRDLRRFVVDN